MPNVTPLRPGDPRRVGRYRLTGRLDEFADTNAGQPDVFLAQRVAGETVVASFVGPGRAGDAAARDRFVAEARAARSVPPFCVARILDAGLEGSQAFLVTEFVPGPSLAEVIAAEGPLPASLVRALAIGCATALAAIHQAGLVHGQFGPHLVVLGRDGPRVMQFSTTPPYGAATPAADILAWAQTVAFAAAGYRPASAGDLAALPGDLRALVAECLSPDPAARPTARSLLTGLLNGPEQPAGLLAEGTRLSRAAARAPLPSPAAGDRPPRRRHSRAVLWVAGCAACVLAIAVAAFFITSRHPAPSAPAAGPGSAAGGPLTAGDATIPARLGGIFAGMIHQTDPSITVAVRVSLAGGTAHGTLAYPQIGCTGKLGLTSATPGMLTFRLAITSGRDSCVSGVIRLAARPDGTITFTFQRSGGSNPTGTLTRQS